MKIAISSLSNRGFRPETVKSLLELNVPCEKEIIIATQGYHIAENRNFMAIQAIKENCDYILMVDDDMIFPPDTLERLLAHKKDVVGVAYKPRNDKKDTYLPLDKTHIDNPDLPKEIFKCEAVGTGVMLINTKILQLIDKPWFAFESHETGYTIQGEDWVFCKQVRKAGFRVWCDPKIEVGHIGTKIF